MGDLADLELEAAAVDLAILQHSLETVPVQVTTVDELHDELGVPDFVKVDVERGELALARGARRLLQKAADDFSLRERALGHRP